MIRRTDSNSSRMKSPWFGVVLFLSILFACVLFDRTSYSQQRLDVASFGTGLDEDPLTLSAQFSLKQDQSGVLTVTAKLSPGWHIYSVTQPSGGPIKTSFKVNTVGVELVGLPTPDHAPESKPSEEFVGILEETHHDKVVWNVPIKVKDPSLKQIDLTVRGQVCEQSCIPINKKVVAKLENPSASHTPSLPVEAKGDKAKAQPSLNAEPFRDPLGHVAWTVELSNDNAKPGDQVELMISGVPDSQYHLYRAEPGTKETNFRTTFIISEKSKLLFGKAEPSVKHIAKDIGGTIYEIHEGPISWKIPIVIPTDASPGLHRFEGLVGYQACTDELCDQPLGIRFQGELNVDIQGQGNRRPLELQAVKFKEVASSVHRLTWVDDLPAASPIRATSQELVAEPKTSEPSQVETGSSDRSKQEEAVAVLPVSQIAQAFVFAILGGFILNFMPCVLPVIGLKVLAFVEESEGSAKHVVWLNFCYIMGTMAVVMALGVATVIANHYSYNLMWGGQFGSQGFRIAILVLVFAMALSFLGVWEIPIPGFATSKKSNELMSKEGGTGAFFKGVITTVLATPCTGPFLGTALTFTLGQPDWIVLLVFFGIGLGISLPFIAIMFFPQAMKWLPKPGPWMDTLKQGLAFPLLFTVVFFLTTFSADYRIAAVSLLIGVWFACWWIGKIPAWAERKSKATGWAGACISAIAIGLFSFQYLGPSPKHIDWKTYNETELTQAVKSGKTVMIEFTAEWCANCKTNMRIAIDTDRVAAAIKSKSVVPMIADFTDFPEHIQEKLDELRCRGIPVLAFYPAGMMNQPVVLQGLLTESQVLKAIEETTGKTSGKWTPVSTSVP